MTLTGKLIDPVTNKGLTSAAGLATQVSLDQAAYVNTTNNPVFIGDGIFTLALTAAETNGVLGAYDTYQDVFIKVTCTPSFFWYPVTVDFVTDPTPDRAPGDYQPGGWCMRSGLYFGIGDLVVDGIGRRVGRDFYTTGYPDLVGPGRYMNWH